MPSLSTRYRIAALALLAAVATFVPWLAGWVTTDVVPEVAGLVATAMLAACLRVHERATADPAIMPPAFVVIFTALMLQGAPAAMVVGAAAALAPAFLRPRTSPRS